MKKSYLFISALAATTLLLTGCESGNSGSSESSEPVCNHVDENPKDHYCDLCGVKVSEHKDENHDHNCDICGTKLSEHKDENPKDHLCDICGNKLSDHIDENHDLICDYCGEEMDGIKEVTISSKRTYIGVGESFSMSGEAVTSGSVTNNSVTFSTENTFVFLEQSENNVKVTASSEKGDALIKATSVFDTTKEKEVTIAVEGWSSTSKSRMSGSTGVLEGANLPYFRTMSDLLKPMGATSVTGQVDLPEYEEAIQALLDGGYSKVEIESQVAYKKSHPTKFGYAIIVEIQGVDITDPESGYYNFIGSLVAEKLTSFPEEAVKSVIGTKSTSQIPVPTDGTEFLILRSDSSLIEVELNGNPETFINSLVSKNYYVNRDNTKTGYSTYVMTASPERTLLVHVSVADNYYTITYTTQTIPSKADWTSSEKTIMMDNFKFVLPFVNVGLSYSSTKKVYTTSRVEAYDMTVDTYKASSDFTWEAVQVTTTSGVVPGYNFSHVFDKYLKLSVLVYREKAQTTVKPSLTTIPLPTWEPEYIANVMGPNALGEVLPEAAGTEYGYNDAGDGYVQVNVTGDINAYKTKLEGLGYSLSYDANYGCYFGYSPKHSIYVEVYDMGSYFAILAANKFEEGYSTSVPVETIVSKLQLESADSLVIPGDGALFHLISNSLCDVTLEVLEGGNKDNFVTALGNASFVETEAGSNIYTKGNVKITVIPGENGTYSINYTLLEKPAPATDWPEDVKSMISLILAYVEWDATELPYPTTISEATIVDETNWIIQVTDGNLTEYLTQLTNAGFGTEYYYGAYYITEGEKYDALVVLDLENGSYIISGEWILY